MTAVPDFPSVLSSVLSWMQDSSSGFLLHPLSLPRLFTFNLTNKIGIQVLRRASREKDSDLCSTFTRSGQVHPEEQYTADDPNREAVAAKSTDGLIGWKWNL